MAVTDEFNKYGYCTIGAVASDTPASFFTIDADTVYLIKGFRLVNTSAGAVTVTVAVTLNATSLSLVDALSVAANTAVDLTNFTSVLRGPDADSIQISASTAGVVHAFATVMKLGRTSGL